MSDLRNQTRDKVISLIVEKLKVQASEVSESTSFQDLGADSIDVFDLILSFEEEFNIEISDEEAEVIKTVGEVIDRINQSTT